MPERRVPVLAAFLQEQRRALLGWAAGWALLLAMYAVAWPAVRAHGSSYDGIVDDLPAALRGALRGPGGTLSLATSEGYLQAEVLALTGPLLAVVLGVLLGSRALAGEEDRGTLELLLAQPVTRRRVVLELAGGVAAGVAAVLAAAAVVLRLVAVPVDLDVSVAGAARTGLLLALLGVEAGAVALLAGAATGRLAAARAVAGVVLAAAYVVHALSASVTGLADLDALTPFGAAARATPLSSGLPLSTVLVLGVPTLLCVAAAVATFTRRDLVQA